MATRRMRSADHLSADRWDEKAAENGTLLPAYAPEPQNGTTSPAGLRSQSPSRNPDEYVLKEASGNKDDQDKWIHRDKLAKIESQELQAAGLFIPRSRAPSKQRSRSTARRGTDASSEHGRSRSRKNSAAVEQRAADIPVPSWDLRTPEEIAEAEASNYFTSNGLKGGSRIPVAKTSPAPIAVDYLERGSPATRKQSESPEGRYATAGSTRSRTGSISHGASDGLGTAAVNGKRSNADASPRKPTAATRKASAGAKSSNAQQARPKTRSGSRPSTRSGDFSALNKQPEGDPPWLANAYKPDPRLPPDQQLLPTVARRLQQEQWAKEGAHGDVYDKEFRPLNDRVLLRPPEAEKPDQAAADEDDQQRDEPPPGAGDEWPLRPDAVKSPRQGSYSTMPKICDKQGSNNLPGPRQPQPPTMFQPQIEPHSPAAQRLPMEKEDDGKKKGGCGCCLVM